jgi:hypothetical protein
VIPPRLLVDISAHGLGHLAQVAPVLECLRQYRPDLHLILRSGLPRERLARRIAEPFHHVHSASDFGFVMHNAVDVDLAASAERYRVQHDHWQDRVATEARLQRETGADMVLANASYLALAGARHADIPAVGMCSLNWADLFAHYFGNEPWAVPIHARMLDAYNAAAVFLRITPGMPMAEFHNRREIGPVAAIAHMPRQHLRRHLAAALGLDQHQRWVLVAMGGMEFRLPVEHWPPCTGVQWLCPAAWNVRREDVFVFDGPEMPLAFTDILAAADTVLTKPGYGTFVEAACNGTPVLYLPRGDWPEERFLVAWLEANACQAAIDRPRLLAGELALVLDSLWAQAPKPLPALDGVQQAHDDLLSILRCEATPRP